MLRGFAVSALWCCMGLRDASQVLHGFVQLLEAELPALTTAPIRAGIGSLQISDQEPLWDVRSDPWRNKPQVLESQFPTVFGHWCRQINVKIAQNEIFQLTATCWITSIQPLSKNNYNSTCSFFFLVEIRFYYSFILQERDFVLGNHFGTKLPAALLLVTLSTLPRIFTSGLITSEVAHLTRRDAAGLCFEQLHWCCTLPLPLPFFFFFPFLFIMISQSLHFISVLIPKPWLHPMSWAELDGLSEPCAALWGCSHLLNRILEHWFDGIDLPYALHLGGVCWAFSSVMPRPLFFYFYSLVFLFPSPSFLHPQHLYWVLFCFLFLSLLPFH